MKSTDICPRVYNPPEVKDRHRDVPMARRKECSAGRDALPFRAIRRESQFPAEGIQEGFLGEVALELGFSMLDIWNNGEGCLGGGARRWVVYMEPLILLFG